MRLSTASGPRAAPTLVSGEGKGQHLSACPSQAQAFPGSLQLLWFGPLGSQSNLLILPSHPLSHTSECAANTLTY